MEQGHDSLVQHVSVLVGIDDTEKICVVLHKDITVGHVELCSRTHQWNGRVVMRAALKLMN